MMAVLAVHDKNARDSLFLQWLRLIKDASIDERNFVKKAVNWALRQIGKRNLRLNRAAIQTAKAIQKLDSKSARWIAADALRELMSDAVQKRLQKTQNGACVVTNLLARRQLGPGGLDALILNKCLKVGQQGLLIANLTWCFLSLRSKGREQTRRLANVPFNRM